MTERQKTFCDEYLIDLNATRAYKSAYPNVKSNNAAAVNGNKLLRNAKIDEYIKKRLDEKEAALIAKQDEVLKALTRVLRREELDTVVTVCKTHKSYYNDNGKKIIEDAEQPVPVQIPAKISDMNKAAELLGKYYNIFDKKDNIDDNAGGVVVLAEVADDE